jgi:hypothetical protein
LSFVFVSMIASLAVNYKERSYTTKVGKSEIKKTTFVKNENLCHLLLTSEQWLYFFKFFKIKSFAFMEIVMVI